METPEKTRKAQRLLKACQQERTAEVSSLLKDGAETDARDPVNGETPLHVASRAAAFSPSFEPIVSEMLRVGADVNAVDVDKETPLHGAARWSTVSMIEKLIAAGATVDARSSSGETPLFAAIRSYHVEVVKALAKAGADLNAVNAKGISPLHFMAVSEEGNCKIARELLALGADPDVRDDLGRTPLHWAVGAKNLDVLKVLVDNGADPFAEDVRGMTPIRDAESLPSFFEVLCAAGKRKMVSGTLPRESTTNSKSDVSSALLLAASCGDAKKIKKLLASGANPNERGNFGTTPLYWAARADSVASIESLLDGGADPFVTDVDGFTPLHVAAYYGSLRAIKLLTKIVDPNARVSENTAWKSFTPLIVSVVKHEHDAIETLIESGADVSIPHETNGTPLMHAVSHCDTRSMEILLKNGADPENSGDGRTVFSRVLSHVVLTRLKESASEKYRSVVELLLEAGVDVDEKHGFTDETALAWAVRKGLEKWIDMFLKHGADPLRKNSSGETAIDTAEKHGRTDIAEKLRQFLLSKMAASTRELPREAAENADALEKNDPVAGEMLRAIEQCDVEKIVELLDDGFPVNATRMPALSTPLHVAVYVKKKPKNEFDSARVVELLLNRGADVRIENWRGATPLHCATKSFNISPSAYELVATASKKAGIIDAVYREKGTALAITTEDPALFAWKALVLLEAGANPNVGQPLPLIAVVYDNSRWSTWCDVVFRSLLEAGADPNARDDSGESVLELVCSNDNVSAAIHLLNAGADPFATKSGRPCYESSKNAHLKLIVKKAIIAQMSSSGKLPRE